jgi:hypothetical protein
VERGGEKAVSRFQDRVLESLCGIALSAGSQRCHPPMFRSSFCFLTFLFVSWRQDLVECPYPRQCDFASWKLSPMWARTPLFQSWLWNLQRSRVTKNISLLYVPCSSSMSLSKPNPRSGFVHRSSSLLMLCFTLPTIALFRNERRLSSLLYKTSSFPPQ